MPTANDTANEAPSPRHYTDAQKEYMYKRGEYVFKAPPVHHGGWSMEMWINYIGDGGWRPSQKTLGKFGLLRK